jgi:hypothetical protein
MKVRIACMHAQSAQSSVLDLLLSHILPKSQKSQCIKSEFYPFLDGCKTWSLTALKQEHRLKMFGNTILKRMTGPNKKQLENGQSCIMKIFIICNFREIKSKG